MTVRVRLDGRLKDLDAAPGDNLREALVGAGILSARNGCSGEGSCGACAVLVEGRQVNTCLLLAGQVEGQEIRTVQSLATEAPAGALRAPRQLSVLQAAFVESGIVQCGYCTPSMLTAAQELLERNPDPDREQIEDALSGTYCRCTGYEQVFGAIQTAARRLADPSYAPPVIPEFRDDLRVVGKRAAKVDAPNFARGGRAFVEDRVSERTCHLKMLGSPHAHAYIKRIDTAAAERLLGVVAVLTHLNTPKIVYGSAGQGFPEPSPYDRRMFGQKLRHVGDRVAAVVAETAEIASQALALIDVEYEVLAPVLTLDDARAPGAPIVHNGALAFVTGGPAELDNSAADPRDGEILYQFPIHADPRRNLAASVSGGIGDVARGFAEADVILEREYSGGSVQIAPLEPHIVYTKMEGDRLVIHASTQVPWHVRRIVARILDVPETRIRVTKERTGGAFGAKQDVVLEDVAAYATWITGRDVLFRYTREEEFIASRTRHPMTIRVKLGARRDGALVAIEMDAVANTGPYGAHCLTVPMNACSKSLPLFLCDNVHFTASAYYSNIAPNGAYQGYGAPQGAFALQLAVCEMAAELGMDPMDLLEKNRVREGAMLEILKCLGEGREGIPQLVYSCGLDQALDQGRRLLDWNHRQECDEADVRIGKGVALVQQGSGLPGLDSANATLTMNGDGTFMLLSGGADLGTGLDTLTTKLAAEVLCARIEDIAITSGDTDVTPFDTGAYASSGTFFSGGAALNAAREMKRKILDAATEVLGEPAENLELVFPSTVRGKTGSATYDAIARNTQSGTGRGQLVATAHFIADKGSFPYGAHFCQVAVNTRTGAVQVQKYYALQDCGTPINPELALGQVYGGVLKTIGHALYEEMVYDDAGRCLNPNFTDYKIPGIGDLPDDFRAILIETDDPFGPFGGKSISEIATNGAAPAIAAAIHDAVGVWMRDWPFTPEKILRALGKLESTSGSATRSELAAQAIQ